MTDPRRTVVDIDALSHGQRVTSISKGGYALERQGSRFFVVREADRNEVEVGRDVVELTMVLVAYSVCSVGDALTDLWRAAKYSPDFEP